MKTALIAIGLMVGVARAEVIVCPPTDAGTYLVGASVFHGERKQYELMGEARIVRGGHDVHFGFNGGEDKWVACWYKPSVARWHRISRDAKSCNLKKRTDGARRVKVTVECD